MSVEIRLRHAQGDFLLDVEFQFGAGVTALFGPSGAGKSTIINAIAGLIRPDEGRIRLDGIPLFDSTQGTWLSAHQRRIGVVFQDARLLPHLSVRNNLLFGWRRAREKVSAGEIDHVIALLGLDAMLERKPRTLSGGERSRVALGRALLMSPRLLLFDEPLAALDAARKAEIFPYLERLHDETNIPMLYVSHLVDEVARLADRVVLIRTGRVRAEGSVFDITSRLDLLTGADRLVPSTVLDATIIGHDGSGLTELSFSGQRLIVPKIPRAIGAHVRVRIDAQDVMLALVEPRHVSANNVLAATVTELRADGPGPEADIQLAIGEAKMIARVTKRSAQRLALAPGMRVFAVIKSVTVGGRDPH